MLLMVVALGPVMLGVVGLSVGLQHILVLEPTEAVVVGDLRPGGCEFERGCWSLADAVFVTETGEDVTVEVEVPTDARAGHKVHLYYNPNDPSSVTKMNKTGGWGLVGMGIAAISFGAFIALYKGNQGFRAAWKLLGMLLFVFTGFALGLMIFFLLMGLDLPVIAIGALFASILPLAVFPLALYPNIRVNEQWGRVVTAFRDQRPLSLWIEMSAWLLSTLLVIAFLMSVAD